MFLCLNKLSLFLYGRTHWNCNETSPKLLTLGIARASTALHSLNRNSALRLGCQLTPSRYADFPYLANARRGRKRDLA